MLMQANKAPATTNDVGSFIARPLVSHRKKILLVREPNGQKMLPATGARFRGPRRRLAWIARRFRPAALRQACGESRMQKLRESRPGNWLRGGAAAEAPDLARTGSGAAPGETGVFAGVGGTTRRFP